MSPTEFSLANSLVNEKKYREALEIYRELIVEAPSFRPYAVNIEIAQSGLDTDRKIRCYDMVIATDLRFPGGSSASTLEEINANYRSGTKTGLIHLPSPVLKRSREFHSGIMSAVAQGKCTLLDKDSSHIETKVLLFRHPSVLHATNRRLPQISAQSVLLIINHPPANAAGRIDYVLTYAYMRARSAYGVEPLVYPIGPLIRSKVEEFYGDSVPLQQDDWVNVFDIERFAHETRTPPAETIRIGRHSRPGKEKWPSTSAEILSAYPNQADIEVKVLGGAANPKQILGYMPSNWTVHEFGEVPPEDFLRGIDVFVYFHHPDWVEAFGRVLIEAMASGLPVIVPHHFQPLLGEAALYATPEQVGETIEFLKDKDHYAVYSRRSGEYARTYFSHDAHIERMRRMVPDINQLRT